MARNLRAEHGAPWPGEEPCLDEQRHRVTLGDRLAVEPFDGEPLRSAATHMRDERSQCRAQPRFVGVAQRNE